MTIKQLSTHISYDDFTKSQTATRLGINNNMNSTETSNAVVLCNNLLEIIRAKVGVFTISSGFRCPKLNEKIGGVATSQHCKGEAADLIFPNFKEAFNKIIALGLPFDQLIAEYGSWIHVSYVAHPRKEILGAFRENGKAVYRSIKTYPEKF